jgi:CheY-like chemotaxis protein
MDETPECTCLDGKHAAGRLSDPESVERCGVEHPVNRDRVRQANATKASKVRRDGSVRICSGLSREPLKRKTPPSDPVLLVDDDPLLIQAIQVGLESHGYQVIAAHDGREGLELLRTRHACLVLLDLEMPGMTGWQFREEQCGDPSIASVPVVVVSSRTDAERQARVMHVAAGLQKPVDLDRLHATVRAQCGGAAA